MFYWVPQKLRASVLGRLRDLQYIFAVIYETLCIYPGSSYPICTVSYYIKWVTTSWTHSTNETLPLKDWGCPLALHEFNKGIACNLVFMKISQLLCNKIRNVLIEEFATRF